MIQTKLFPARCTTMSFPNRQLSRSSHFLLQVPPTPFLVQLMLSADIEPAEFQQDNESSDKTVVVESASRDGDEDDSVVVLDSVPVCGDREGTATCNGIKSSGSERRRRKMKSSVTVASPKNMIVATRTNVMAKVLGTTVLRWWFASWKL